MGEETLGAILQEIHARVVSGVPLALRVRKEERLTCSVVVEVVIDFFSALNDLDHDARRKSVVRFHG